MNVADESGPTYHEVFASLANVILEDSWVLNVAASLTQLTFVLDVVLTQSHPDYSPPQSGKARCYRRGTLTVESDAAVFLHWSLLPPATDGSGELDYGNIDTFCPVSDLGDEVWELSGSWGEAVARKPRVRVELRDAAEN